MAIEDILGQSILKKQRSGVMEAFERQFEKKSALKTFETHIPVVTESTNCDVKREKQQKLNAMFHHKYLTSSQRAAIALNILPKLEKEARERQLETVPGKGQQGFQSHVVAIVPPHNQGKARDKAAKFYGTNPRYISDAKKIQKSDPELLEQVKTGEITMPCAKRELTKRQRAITHKVVVSVDQE